MPAPLLLSPSDLADLSLRTLAEDFALGQRFEFPGFARQPSSIEWATLSAFGAGTWLWDMAEGQLQLSPRFLQALGSEQLVESESELDFMARIHGEDQARLLAALHDHLAGRWPLALELRMHTAHDDIRHFRLVGQRLRLPTGCSIDAVAGGIEDISERVRLADELRESRTQMQLHLERSQRMQAQLLRSSRAAGMADVASNLLHGIGNTVNSLSVQVESALDRWQQDECQSLQRLAAMLSDGGDLADHVRSHPRGQLLSEFISALSERFVNQRDAHLQGLQLMHEGCRGLTAELQQQRALAGPSNLITTVHILEVVSLALEGYRPRLDALAMRCEVDIPAELCVRSDADKIHHILARLIENAITALTERADGKAPDTAIDLHLTAHGLGNGGVEIEVRDLGCGIPNTIEIFRMGWSTRADAHGLGLHMAAVTAQSLQGSLTAEGPETLGLGSRFIVRLNPAEGPCGPQQTAYRPPPAANQGQRRGE